MWEPRAEVTEPGSCFPQHYNTLHGLSHLSFLCQVELPSRLPAGLLYPRTYVMSTCPRGPFSSESHILCNTYCLASDEQTRNSGRKGSYSARRGRGSWWWDISGSLGALLASRTALLSAPVGTKGIFKGNPGLRVG